MLKTKNKTEEQNVFELFFFFQIYFSVEIQKRAGSHSNERNLL